MESPPIQLIHNVPHAAPWGLLVAQYTYFAGLSAGAFVVSAAWTVLGIARYQALAKPAAAASLVLIVAAALCLLADLEQPLRFWLLFASFGPRSTISWGAWLLAAYLLAGVANMCLLDRPSSRASQAAGAGGAVIGLCLACCGGLALSTAKARAFWNGPLLPPHFVVSSLMCGFALMLIYAVCQERRSPGRGGVGDVISCLARGLRGATALGLVLIVGHLAVLASRGGAPRLSALVAVRDPRFLVTALASHVVPLAILCLAPTDRSPRWQTIASLLVLVGGLCARYTLLAIGQAMPLT